VAVLEANIAGATKPIVLRGHQGAVWGAILSTDGRNLLTTSSDGTVRIWRTGAISPPLVLDGFRASAQTIAALTDNRYVTGHDDGTVRIWRCRACGPLTDVLTQADHRVTRELTAEERQLFLPADP
jgi:WD40 repeat protein